MPYSFVLPPSQFAYINSRLGQVGLRASYGIRDQWDAPFAIWHAPEGLDAVYPASRHATLTTLHHRSVITRTDKAGRGMHGGGGYNDLIMYSGGYDRQYLCTTDASCNQIYVTQELLAQCGREVFGRANVELRDNCPFLEDAPLRAAAEAYVHRGLDTSLPPTRLEMNARAVMIALHLVTNYSNCARPQVRNRYGLSGRKLNTVIEHIDANLDGNLRVADLAAEAGMGNSQFFAAFRATTGTTPHAFLLKRRLEKARSLLRGKCSLSEIALECGFASQQHFSTAFQKDMGTSPGTWRKAVRDQSRGMAAESEHAVG